MGNKKSILVVVILSLAVILSGFSLTGPTTVSAASKNESAINITDIVMKKGQSRTIIGNSMNFIRDNALEATVHDGLFVRATDTTGIYNYLEGNGLIK